MHTRGRHYTFSKGTEGIRAQGTRGDASLYPDGRVPSPAMRSARPAALALLLAILLFWAVASPRLAQGPAGRMTIATDYELFGTAPLTGGGHVTWTLTGEEARELRAKILHLFDEYAQIPRGFTYGGGATGRVPDGRIDTSEGLAYTGFVENELEGTQRGQSGTSIGYFLLDRSDLIDKDAQVGFNRSTAGLLGTDINSTEDVQIRFLFNGVTTTTDAVVPLSTRAFADALHAVFSFEQVQSPTLTPSGGYLGAWPFLAEGGWRITTVDGRPALGVWNNTSYAPGMDASMRTFMDPVLAPQEEGFDLRFASSVQISFSYTGQVADAGDRLTLELARSPTYTDWAPLSINNSLALPPTPLGAWSNVSVNLSSYIGQQVRLRFRFVSDPVGVDRGFFIRDFAIRAPSTYVGEIAESNAHYLIGTLSFSDPRIGSGGLHAIRTPGGEILFYSATWGTGVAPDDSIRFRTFDVAENPQILFGVMLVAAYVISRTQEAAYDRYRDAHPSVYRPAVRKAKWLHNLGKVSMAALVLLYFIPTALFAIGLRVFVGGPAYGFLALTLALSLGLGTRAYYKQKLEVAPPPIAPEEAPLAKASPVPAAPVEAVPLAHCTSCLKEIPQGDKTYACSCGAPYHLRCAAGLMRCSNCRKPIAVEILREKKAVSMRCETCGEIATVPEGADPRAVMCPSCGGRLRHLDVGKRYLIQASNPAIAFGWMRDLTKGGTPALCLTPASPERLRLEFGVKNVQILQVSSTGPDSVDPKKLDPVGLKAILPLARAGKGGVILYDGLEQIVTQSSLGEVVRFLRKANDMAFVHGVTVIARIGPGVLTNDEVRRLRAEFDEMMDLSAQL